MKKNIFLFPILASVIFFILVVLLFAFIDSPAPYFAGLFVAYLVFEIVFFYRFNKNKTKIQL